MIFLFGEPPLSPLKKILVPSEKNVIFSDQLKMGISFIIGKYYTNYDVYKKLDLKTPKLAEL